MNLNSQVKDLCVYIKFSVLCLALLIMKVVLYLYKNVETGSLDRFGEFYLNLGKRGFINEKNVD